MIEYMRFEHDIDMFGEHLCIGELEIDYDVFDASYDDAYGCVSFTPCIEVNKVDFEKLTIYARGDEEVLKTHPNYDKIKSFLSEYYEYSCDIKEFLFDKLTENLND